MDCSHWCSPGGMAYLFNIDAPGEHVGADEHALLALPVACEHTESVLSAQVSCVTTDKGTRLAS